MKKFLLISVLSAFVFSFIGCGKNSSSQKEVIGVLLRNDNADNAPSHVRIFS